MSLIFFILVIIVSIVLAFFVLIQNPEGGGLSGSIGGFSNQIMGVKKTNNVLEKGTWVFAAILSIMCLFSVIIFSGKSTTNNDGSLKKLNTTAPAQQQAPMPAAPQQSTPATPVK
ncbi:preprotein translocase subunit SecG [Arachidicoccus sp.]|uniref:preprotein translocase subunit SecG n=1 Tax=Arachidicoccus sp. TaxID=1872624 RepID=UPI003D20BBFA